MPHALKRILVLFTLACLLASQAVFAHTNPAQLSPSAEDTGHCSQVVDHGGIPPLAHIGNNTQLDSKSDCDVCITAEVTAQIPSTISRPVEYGTTVLMADHPSIPPNAPLKELFKPPI